MSNDSNRGIGPLFYEFARYGMAFRDRRHVTLGIDPMRRNPREVLEELRENDPDAHALLTELIVLPEERSA